MPTLDLVEQNFKTYFYVTKMGKDLHFFDETWQPFDDDDEAVALANNSTYGLAATAWTNDLGRAHRLAKRLKAGTVGLNCQMQYDHSMPFGGYKQSGWGHESGKAGIEAYLQTKIVWAQM